MEMRRREFIAALSGAITVGGWSTAADAQSQSRAVAEAPVPAIGFLSVRSQDDAAADAEAFRSGLLQAGYAEGRNVRIEYRWGNGEYDRLPALAQDLIQSQVGIIAAFGPVPALAAKALTTTIPIVFTSSADPVRSGLVTSLSRPEGNVTGVSLLAVDLGLKRLEILHQLVPNLASIGFIVHSHYTAAASEANELETAGRTIGIQVRVLTVGSDAGIDNAFDTLVGQDIKALMIPGDAFFNRVRPHLVELASRHRLAAIYPWREYAAAGGLVSYGTSISDGFRQVGVCAGKILAGARPSELPALQPTKFELVIDLKTATVLGLSIPTPLLARADAVIE